MNRLVLTPPRLVYALTGFSLCGLLAAASPQPVLYYAFEEQSGTSVANQGALGGSGTLVNSPLWVTGTPGVADGGLRCNGQSYATASYVDSGFTAAQLGVHNTNGTFAVFTMAAWVKGGKPEIPGSTYNDEFVFGQLAGNNVLHLGIRDQRPHFGNWGDDITGNAFVMQTGTWYHVVWQLDESNIQRIYVNGAMVARRQSTGPGIKQNLNIVVGTSTTGSRTLLGDVDDAAIYTNALSVSQIQYLAGGGSPLTLPEAQAVDDVYYTAPTGPNNTWNLYRVLGGATGPVVSWYEGHLAATVPDPVGGSVTGHLAAVSNMTENEWCRYLRNLYGLDAWIGLTDNDTNSVGLTFPGAYESGTTNTVPDLTTRRNNGWVWTSGEPYGAAAFQNWTANEPNDNPSEDAVEITDAGLWNDLASGIPGSGDATTRQLAIVEWDLQSPVPVPGALVRPAILPPPAELPGEDEPNGSFSGVWVRAPGAVGNARAAVAALLAGAATAATADEGIHVINVYDPETPADKDKILFPNESPGFAQLPGVSDTNWVAFYRGMIVVPETGDYTFGAHSDDGFVLRILGQEWSAVHGLGSLDHGDTSAIAYEYGTGDSNTRGVINLPAGVHKIEFLTWNGTGGQHHELYAARGVFTNDADTTTWRLVGHRRVGDLVFAGVAADWTLWHSVNEAVGNIDLAWAAVSNYVATGTNPSTWPEINFYDPQSGGTHAAALPDSEPFPWDTAADDDAKALFARATLTVPATTTLGLGFQGDDGSRLTVSNQTWNALLETAVPASTYIEGDSIVMNAGTGNSRTVGSITLAAGTYPVSILYWEGTGGSYLDVFQRNLQAYDSQLPKSLTYRPLSTTSAEAMPDIDGLLLKRTTKCVIFIR